MTVLKRNESCPVCFRPPPKALAENVEFWRHACPVHGEEMRKQDERTARNNELCNCGHPRSEHSEGANECRHIEKASTRMSRRYGRHAERYVNCTCRAFHQIVRTPICDECGYNMIDHALNCSQAKRS